jgi:hypothetical protein
LGGCDEFLDTETEGAAVTEAQKNAAVKDNPSLLAADVAAMNANMIALAGVLGSMSYHDDFGYAAACLYMDCNGADMTAANIGYNWFVEHAAYTDRVYTLRYSSYMWSLFYKQIASANIVVAAVDPGTGDPTLRGYLGQALAVRAFDYLHLAQLHQFTCKGHEQEKCVPIVTEKTTAEEASNNPRASVDAVYKFIMSDLHSAVRLLASAQAGGFKRPDKGYVDLGVAYGLRARANLLMRNYAEAAADADSALAVSGAAPYTLAQASAPAFYDANDKNVLWANIITANNDVVKSGIINAPSHLCSFYTNGYTAVGCWKKINKPLYDAISMDDVRKQWWLDGNEASELVKDAVYDEWRKTASGEADFGPYTNVKFAPDGGTDGLYNQTPAQDWFLMRAEELILIKAEGLAMSGKAGEAKTVLEAFVNTCRMKGGGYSAPANPAALVDAIWFQRRIELWGEGFSFFDIMRLEKPVERVVNGVSSFPDAHRFNIDPNSPILLWLVPKSEIEANGGISEADNNAKVDPPKP